MGLSYSPYQLTATKSLNSQMNKTVRSGVLLKFSQGKEVGYADYHPWTKLGDIDIPTFLTIIKYHPEHPLTQVMKSFLRDDISWQNHIPQKSFFNHDLCLDFAELTQQKKISVIKMKIGHQIDKEQMAIKKVTKKFPQIRLRLDANHALSLKQTLAFWNMFSPEEKTCIEYLEDPFPYHASSWRELKKYNIPLGLDHFAENTQDISPDSYDFLIFKPNIKSYDSFKKNNKDMIFSSSMGHDLGRFHSYCRLLEKGDLNLYHGIHTPHIYEEQQDIFLMKENRVTPQIGTIKKFYEELAQRKWIPL